MEDIEKSDDPAEKALFRFLYSDEQTARNAIPTRNTFIHFCAQKRLTHSLTAEDFRSLGEYYRARYAWNLFAWVPKDEKDPIWKSWVVCARGL